MEKKSTKIAYFVALGIFIVLLVILGLQFKGKENPVFVGGGAFYTTGDGVFLDGILKTADDSEGSKYALDGSYYVSPEAGTYFELSEDGNTIVGADGTEYVKSEEKSKDVNGVEYTTYEEKVYSETPFAGTFWSLLPPIVAIVLALISKEVYSSLFLGCLVGALLYTQFAPWDTIVTLVGADYGIISVLADSGNMGIIVFLVTLGIMVDLMNKGGGSEAFGRWAKKTVHTRCGAQLLTMLLGVLIFVDDYFNCLTVGAVMRPVTDKTHISRVKLAYITDAMGAPLVSMSPISDNGVYLVGLLAAEIAALNLTGVGAYDLYFGMFQFNLYGVFSVITVLLVILFGLDVGPMYKAEKLAIETGKTYSDTDNLIATPPETDFAEDCKLSMANFLAPMITLILTIFAVVFYTGQIWVNGFIGCFGHANIQMAIAMCFLTGSIAAGIVGIKSKLITLGGAIDKWTKGAASMMQVIMILVCAWSISGLTKSMNIGQFLTGVVQDSIPAALIPAILFLIGVVVSFATGSSWGVWALGMPIALPMANAMGIPLTLAIGAVVSGGLFGDHCSPISDTTIQSSTSACCDHLQHVKTQLPYALTVGISSLIGFLFAGLVAPVLALPVTLVCIIAALLVMKNISRKRAAVAA